MADLLRKTKSLFATTANTFGTGTSVTITPNSVSGLPTDTEITLTFDRVDSTGAATPTKMERIIGTISGGNFSVRTSPATGRGADGTSDQAHTSPVVEYIPNAKDMNDLVDAILVGHLQSGAHKTSLPLTSPVLTTPIVVTPVVKTAHAIGAAGATETVNWANGDLQTMTLDENITITFSGAVAGQRLTLFMLQDGSGTNTITWADTIVWQDGATWSDSLYSKTADKMNVVVIYYSGSAYFGMVGKFA